MSNLTSKQAAIDAVLGVVPYDEYWKEQIEKAVNALPSEQPGIDEWCHNCKEYDQQKHCCPRWNRVIRETVEELKSEQSDFDITVKIDKAYDDGYKTGYLQGRYDWGDLDG